MDVDTGAYFTAATLVIGPLLAMHTVPSHVYVCLKLCIRVFLAMHTIPSYV